MPAATAPTIPITTQHLVMLHFYKLLSLKSHGEVRITHTIIVKALNPSNETQDRQDLRLNL